jgi:internalin A
VQNVNMLTNGQITPNPKVLPHDFLGRLSALSELSELGLENTVIDKEDWHNIARFLALKYVNLGRSNISDEGVDFLSRLPSLDTVSMDDAREITDKSLPAFSRMVTLTNLKLGSAKLTDDGLRQLSPPQLTILELQGVKLTSRCATAFGQMPKLQILLLDWTNVDDQALEQLAGLPDLQHLQLQATKATREGVARFREAHPNCTVTGP